MTQAESLAPGYAQHANFQTQWGLANINAELAYAHVSLLKGATAAPGAGVTIGFIDTGIDDQHPVFAGKTISEQLLTGASQETGDRSSHGTAVASIAAGGRIGGSDAAHGVAWGADIAMFAIVAGTGNNIYNPISLAGLAASDNGWATEIGTVLNWRSGSRKVDILNLSVGYDGLIDIYSEADLRANFGSTIAAIAQTGSTDKTIFVWSAGNANGDSCEATHANCVNGQLNAVSVSVLPGLVARIAELQGHSVAVVALSASGGITGFSNHCGIAAAYCIAAPGEDMTLAYFGPDSMGDPSRGYRTGRGTSYAAPVVAGGLAIMRQLFRDQLSNPELLTRLFATADKTGYYAVANIYGQGKMDLGAATSPVGVLEVPILFGTTTAAHASLNSTGLRLGAAFGDGLAEALDGGEFMALDDFGAPFWYGLGNFAATTDGPSLAARLRSFLGPGTAPGWLSGATGGGGPGPGPGTLGMSAGVLRMPTAAGNGHLALAEGAVMVSAFERGGLSATAFTTGPRRPQLPAAGAALGWRPEGFPVGFTAGWIDERETMLGSFGQGAFGGLSAGTAFVGFDGGWDLGSWRFGANGEFGVVNPVVQGGMIREISPLATSTFGVHASRTFASRGALHFSWSQPLRVEDGWASLTVPAARTKQGEVLHRSLRADLAPGERQLDLAAQWNRPLPLGEFRLGAVWSRRPGHRDVLGPQLALLSGWRWTF